MSEADGGYGAGEESQVVDLTDDAAQVPADEADDVPAAPRTGDAGVDEAVTALRAAVGGALDGQVAAYDAAHRALQDRLADVEG